MDVVLQQRSKGLDQRSLASSFTGYQLTAGINKEYLMAAHRAGKCQPAVPGNALLSAWYADRKLNKQRQTPQWKLASAVASNRYLLIAKPHDR